MTSGSQLLIGHALLAWAQEKESPPNCKVGRLPSPLCLFWLSGLLAGNPNAGTLKDMAGCSFGVGSGFLGKPGTVWVSISHIYSLQLPTGVQLKDHGT